MAGSGAGRLQNKVALVFGASPYNGGTCAHFMAREGARLVVSDILPAMCAQTAAFLKQRGFDAIGLPGDASEEPAVAAIVAQAIEHYGRIDIMLNLAGTQYRHDVLEMNLFDWNRMLKGYLTAGMLTTKHVARAMVEKQTPGSIIHIISDAGHQGEAGNSAYSAAKAGLLNFSRAAAAEFGRYGIRVNTISPTFIDHLFSIYLPGRFNPRIHAPYSLTADDFLQGIPLGRFCTAMDVANAAVFLASEEASFITGTDLALDGGARSKYWPWMPGKWSGITTEEYLAHTVRHRYGEPIPAEATPANPNRDRR
jgi:NAD(P)-dependent dehydrogenase (short-subunit alcohol dehydrogenase family)